METICRVLLSWKPLKTLQVQQKIALFKFFCVLVLRKQRKNMRCIKERRSGGWVHCGSPQDTGLLVCISNCQRHSRINKNETNLETAINKEFGRLSGSTTACTDHTKCFCRNFENYSYSRRINQPKC